MNLKNNLRARKTLNTIKQTFKEMLMEMDFEKITITELCNRADINRRTFYSHFDSLDDLLITIQNDLSSEFYERIKDYDHILNVEELVKEYFLFSEENGKLTEKLHSNINFDYIRQQVTNNVTLKVYDNNFKSIENYDIFTRNVMLNYLNSATVGIYKQWIKDGRKLSLDHIIEIASKLIKSGISSMV